LINSNPQNSPPNLRLATITWGAFVWSVVESVFV